MSTATEHPDVAAALRGRHFLTLDRLQRRRDPLPDRPLRRAQGGQARRAREEQQLVGKEIALIFEKDSTRTRCAFEVAAYDQGAHVTFIGPSGSHMGHKETVKDTARVLGRMYDAIEYRGFGESDRRRARAVGGRAGLQRPHRRVAPDADARRLPDDARAPRQAATRRWRSATSATPASTWPTATWSVGAKLGHGRADRRAEVAVAGGGAGRHGARASPTPRAGSVTITEDVEEAVARLRLPAHRRVGLDGRVRRGLGRAHRAAHALPDQRRRRWR